MDFEGFAKVPRLSRECVITEKIDGTNAQILIGENNEFFTGSKNKWITPEDDNRGFAKWAHENKEDLLTLGPGRHFGEWWGQGIGRKYNLKEKRFSLFNTSRWGVDRPTCCHVTPVLYEGLFLTDEITLAIAKLAHKGSVASPGFMNPEGIIIFHVAANMMFKKTILNDEKPKGTVEEDEKKIKE